MMHKDIHAKNNGTNAAYYSCVGIVALALICRCLGLTLGIDDAFSPYSLAYKVTVSFGFLVPRFIQGLFPPIVNNTVTVGMLSLMLRRVCLFMAGEERVPASFTGFLVTMCHLGLFSIFLSIIGLSLSAVVSVMDHIPNGLLMLPATFCIPWTFAVTELLSFKPQK